MVSDFLARASSNDVSERFGTYYDAAMMLPNSVERDGEALVVMMPAEEYMRLARLDHVALLPRELYRDDLTAIRNTSLSESARDLDSLLD